MSFKNNFLNISLNPYFTIDLRHQLNTLLFSKYRLSFFTMASLSKISLYLKVGVKLIYNKLYKYTLYKYAYSKGHTQIYCIFHILCISLIITVINFPLCDFLLILLSCNLFSISYRNAIFAIYRHTGTAQDIFNLQHHAQGAGGRPAQKIAREKIGAISVDQKQCHGTIGYQAIAGQPGVLTINIYLVNLKLQIGGSQQRGD